MRAFRRSIGHAATTPDLKKMVKNLTVFHTALHAILQVIPGEDSMTPSSACLSLVKQFEGCAEKQQDGRFTAYPDPGSGGDPWTIGWGTTGTDVKPGVIWTQQQCDDRLGVDIGSFAGKVSAVIGGANTSQHQFDAMVSFAYNVGIGNLSSSTLLRKHKAGDFAGAAAEFGRWNKAAGKVMNGLTRRRAAEAALYAN
jgi:GH24 family phage-related lysozyme (muramidase)